MSKSDWSLRVEALAAKLKNIEKSSLNVPVDK